MENEFGLNYMQTTLTTLGNTAIDYTFIRNINFDILPYVSYFSYDWPILNKIIVEYYLKCYLYWLETDFLRRFTVQKGPFLSINIRT